MSLAENTAPKMARQSVLGAPICNQIWKLRSNTPPASSKARAAVQSVLVRGKR
jgi:hypothetical protein